MPFPLGLGLWPMTGDALAQGGASLEYSRKWDVYLFFRWKSQRATVRYAVNHVNNTDTLPTTAVAPLRQYATITAPCD